MDRCLGRGCWCCVSLHFEDECGGRAGESAFGGRSTFVDGRSADIVASSANAIVACIWKYLERPVFTGDVGDDVGRGLVCSLSFFNSGFSSFEKSLLATPSQSGQSQLVVRPGFMVALTRVVMGETGRSRSLNANRRSLSIVFNTVCKSCHIGQKRRKVGCKSPRRLKTANGAIGVAVSLPALNGHHGLLLLW